MSDFMCVGELARVMYDTGGNRAGLIGIGQIERNYIRQQVKYSYFVIMGGGGKHCGLVGVAQLSDPEGRRFETK